MKLPGLALALVLPMIALACDQAPGDELGDPIDEALAPDFDADGDLATQLDPASAPGPEGPIAPMEPVTEEEAASYNKCAKGCQKFAKELYQDCVAGVGDFGGMSEQECLDEAMEVYTQCVVLNC